MCICIFVDNSIVCVPHLIKILILKHRQIQSLVHNNIIIKIIIIKSKKIIIIMIIPKHRHVVNLLCIAHSFQLAPWRDLPCLKLKRMSLKEEAREKREKKSPSLKEKGIAAGDENNCLTDRNSHHGKTTVSFTAAFHCPPDPIFASLQSYSLLLS